MLKRFISYYRPHRRLFILDMLASLAVSLVGILYPIITRLMLNDLIPEKRYRTIILCGAGLLLLYIVRMLLNYFIQFYGHVMGVRMQAQMRSDMFRHLERLPYSFYDNHETGKIMSRMTNDLQDISELAHHGPENLITSTVSVIVSFIYLCTINWKLTLTIFICIPFLLAAALVLRRKMREAFRQSRISIAQINAALESSISGIRVTKAFTNQAKEEEKFEEGNRSYIKARSEAYRAMGQFHSTTSFITDVFNVIVLVAGGLILFGAFGGEVMQLGDYTAFVTSISLFITPVMTLINFMEQYQTGVTGFERFVEIMDEPVEQGGRNLSGGQKQRLTIARALVGKPDILILDDSASALDYATDAALRKALAALPGALTVFIVSQRAASLQHADQILVLDDGHLVGIGTHSALRSSCPVYEEIYESQFKKGEAEA